MDASPEENAAVGSNRIVGSGGIDRRFGGTNSKQLIPAAQLLNCGVTIRVRKQGLMTSLLELAISETSRSANPRLPT